VQSAVRRLYLRAMLHMAIKVLLDMLEVQELGVLQLVVEADRLLFVGCMQQFGRLL